MVVRVFYLRQYCDRKSDLMEYHAVETLHRHAAITYHLNWVTIIINCQKPTDKLTTPQCLRHLRAPIARAFDTVSARFGALLRSVD